MRTEEFLNEVIFHMFISVFILKYPIDLFLQKDFSYKSLSFPYIYLSFKVQK